MRVTGSEWVPSDCYTVKLEGARRAGYQSVLLTLLRDRRYVENVDSWCEDITRNVKDKAKARLGIGAEDFEVELRIIGQNATLGALENRANGAVELGVLGIVTAQRPELVEEIGKMLNPYLLHHPLTAEEEQPTFAFPFSPAEIERGEIYEFCLNHVMQLDDPMQAFRLEVHQIG